MRWRTGRRSTRIDDRRGQRVSRGPMRVGKMSGGMILVVIVVGLLLGQDLGDMLGIVGEMAGTGTSVQTQTVPVDSAQDEIADFVAVVLGETEDTWNGIFTRAGQRYSEPVLVLYSGAVQSACGFNTAATGPFYCPGDYQVYLDLDFLGELQKLGAPGDFAFAYVIAHEIGHHVQNLLGTAGQVRQQQARVSRADANALSVMMELQADCYAGVWANDANRRNQILEEGDVEEGLAAAAAVGDDRLQKMAGRAVHPESFTHGTSEQRMSWFRRGLETGDPAACNTFEAG